jgi:hypothetical protein
VAYIRLFFAIESLISLDLSKRGIGYWSGPQIMLRLPTLAAKTKTRRGWGTQGVLGLAAFTFISVVTR